MSRPTTRTVAEMAPPHNRRENSEPHFNIIPVDNSHTDHPSLRPEVRVAAAALRVVRDLPRPRSVTWHEDKDILDWLGAFFGFQRDNVRNQREHLVLHLANAQMRLQPRPDNIDSLDFTVLRRFRHKLLKNYTAWCSYLGCKSNVLISNRPAANHGELLYTSLYLLIWGEAANLRFVPECICYIFHHMAMELNRIMDENTAHPNFLTSISGEDAFLNEVVTPIYKIIREEIKSIRNGTAHSAWRNYDDINEYFWSRRCFERLKWPIDRDSNFFATTAGNGKGVGKTGFVEQRSFWNVFRSFDRLWIMLILFLQVAIIVAWEGKEFPWQALESRIAQVRILTVFITWAGLRFLQSLLDAGTQYSLVSRETVRLGVRMLLKTISAAAWTVLFGVFYGRIWSQKYHDDRWSDEANLRVVYFLKAAFVFVLPELLALSFFIVPGIASFIEEKNWKIFYVLTWWFQSRSFVGRGLREGIVDHINYTLFWAVVLASKFSFSYFFQIKPMIAPTKAVLNFGNIRYNWHELFSYSSNGFAVGLLWLPVVLIYLMDLHIWYSLFSSIFGAMVGLFLHLGEIRNIRQLRLRFQFFASAMKFTLMPEEQLTNNTGGELMSKFKDAVHRLQLRYGLGRPYKKIESEEIEAKKFAFLWNEIIKTFREEDIISDREVELLELPEKTWNIRVIRWPCLLLCNELLLALSQANQTEDAPDKLLRRKIRKHAYRLCAVIEAYDTTKHLLLEIVKDGSEESSIVRTLFQEIDDALQREKFTTTFKMTALPQIHSKLVSLVELVSKPKKDVNKVINALRALYEAFIRDLLKKQLKQDGLVLLSPAASTRRVFENAVDLPDVENASFYRQVRSLHTILTCKDSMHNIPTNLEARRRIAFFSNSLFMNMPRAPQVEKMMAFSVLTPYYNEDVLYSKKQLQTKNEDGISILFYLQKIYYDEWRNFIERLRREGMVDDEKEIWTTKLRDLRLWASYRGQTLSRTVRGMMYYYKALQMLAYLDASVASMRRDSSVDGLGSSSSSTSSPSLCRASSGVEYATAVMKYTYVIACQNYGSQKAKKEAHAEEILYLMKNNEALRVAYVDEVIRIGKDENEYYSVLVKYDHQSEKEVEIYRIRLPGSMKLGEGKPENQNHAIIFTRGDAVQTIDMNQDNYFEEALKMRNLLEEFKTKYGIRKPTILGVREHVFTGSVSSLARFMSAQETSFFTSGQRVLANPLKVRMHYGHPDVFDRFWFLTRGGISKASRMINISEDIFAGFNCTLRGGNVTHHEYIQVGKGRDVGLNQISIFEAKVASGNGEQVLSRDVYRLGHRLDFFRMLSFFYSSVGFFFNTMMVVLTLYAFLWGRLYLSLSGIVKEMVDSSNNNIALGTILDQQFIIQMGLFTALLMIVENSLEHGFLSAVWDFLMMQLQLSSVFYTFSLGTRTHFFGRTILHGGAKYQATGRGFVVQHKSFAENYRLYSRSHFVKAIELGMLLIVYSSYSSMAKDTNGHLGIMISSCFLVVSWIMAPFVFNPSGFYWLKTIQDFHDFMNWMWYRGDVFTKEDQSWETWWYKEHDHLRTTSLCGKLLEVILDLRFFFLQYGIVHQLGDSAGNTRILVYILSWIYTVVAMGFFAIQDARNRYDAKIRIIYYRLVQFLVIVLPVLVIVVLLKFTHFKYLDILTSLVAFIPNGWGVISIALVFRHFRQSTEQDLNPFTVVWETVVSLARLYDLLFGVIVILPVALLSWMPGFQSMQTRILFNEAFSRGLEISRILAVANKSNVD